MELNYELMDKYVDVTLVSHKEFVGVVRSITVSGLTMEFPDDFEQYGVEFQSGRYIFVPWSNIATLTYDYE